MLPPTNQHPTFTGRMPFLSPNQQCQSIEGNNITFHGLAYPKLTWGLPTLSLTSLNVYGITARRAYWTRRPCRIRVV